MTSCSNDRFELIMQEDGNLVLRRDGKALWHTQTNGTAANRAVMQSDGNLVLYDASNRSYWNAGTYGNPDAFLQLTDEHLAIRTAERPVKTLW